MATIDNESFIVTGGDFHWCEPLSSCEIYNKNTNQWTRLPKDMSEGRYRCGAATIDRHIYVVGGRLEVVGTDSINMSTMVAYSLDSKEWISKKRMKQAREGFAVTVSNDRLFIFGGIYYNNVLNVEIPALAIQCCP